MPDAADPAEVPQFRGGSQLFPPDPAYSRLCNINCQRSTSSDGCFLPLSLTERAFGLGVAGREAVETLRPEG